MKAGSSLVEACCANDIELIKAKLVNVKPAQLRKSTQATVTPLHVAAQNGNRQAVDWLIAAGADLEQGDFLGNNAMLACFANGKLDMVQYLIEKRFGC